VRGDLVAAVIDSVVSTATAGEASDAELEAFHAQNADYFARPGRLRVQALLVRPREGEAETAARARAQRAAARVRSGESISGVEVELGEPQVAPLPDVLLPPIKIREYLGPTALRQLLELEAGGVSDPIATPGGIWVLQVVEREPSRTIPFDELRAEVRAEWRRREGDRALRAYLDDLRDQGNVHVREPLP
jgi:parvulin-like peptidyl-prolyl isomerase